ncbi:hypothetical protein BRADI_5g22172v3 [Brachypodium distachyon]|uniref:Uncharacterized protein n=1 Tax=Brachypodium distachyon TaxID=15368 RepID=A0A0Q3EE16_BRADI|nr:hypothetical protein BRADI_5g22172v3 [Brachypodium distachyon]
MAAGSLVSDALLDAEKLPGILISCGFFKAVGSSYMIISNAPGGMVLFVLSWAILAVTLIFGIFEIAAGLWVSADPFERRADGKKIMYVSIVLLVVMLAALEAFASLK